MSKPSTISNENISGNYNSKEGSGIGGLMKKIKSLLFLLILLLSSVSLLSTYFLNKKLDSTIATFDEVIYKSERSNQEAIKEIDIETRELEALRSELNASLNRNKAAIENVNTSSNNTSPANTNQHRLNQYRDFPTSDLPLPMASKIDLSEEANRFIILYDSDIFSRDLREIKYNQSSPIAKLPTNCDEDFLIDTQAHYSSLNTISIPPYYLQINLPSKENEVSDAFLNYIRTLYGDKFNEFYNQGDHFISLAYVNVEDLPTDVSERLLISMCDYLGRHLTEGKINSRLDLLENSQNMPTGHNSSELLDMLLESRNGIETYQQLSVPTYEAIFVNHNNDIYNEVAKTLLNCTIEFDAPCTSPFEDVTLLYQKEKGLYVTGKLDLITLSQLGLRLM